MKRTVENDQYIAAIARMVRSAGQRVADGNVEDLAELDHLLGFVNFTLNEAVRIQRATHGYSWAEVGKALGITRQAAQQRFGKPNPSA